MTVNVLNSLSIIFEPKFFAQIPLNLIDSLFEVIVDNL